MLKEGRKQSNPANYRNKLTQARHTLFAFCEKKTGTTRFVVEGAADGSVPLDQAASLLAMNCLVRGQAPGDYVMMVSAGDNLSAGIAARAEELLEAAGSITSPVRLSRREEEVLRGVCQNLANKEIAAALYISERTVKFHVSALLAKFGVRNRIDLMREAAQMLASNCLRAAPVSLPTPSREAWTSPLERRGGGKPPQANGGIQPAPGNGFVQPPPAHARVMRLLRRHIPA